MKKYILSLALPLIALSLAVVFILPTSTNAAPEVVCPAGYTCTPVVSGGGGGGSSGSGGSGVVAIPVVVVAGGTNIALPVACFDFTRTLVVGSTGNDVVALQTFLISKGFSIPLIEDGSVPKGVFGPSTKVALAKYQTAMGIESTGSLGPITRAKINASCGIERIRNNRLSTTTVTSTPGASVQVNSSNLTLAYLNQTENLLTATYAISLNGGSNGLYVYNWSSGHSFIDERGVVTNASNKGLAFVPVNSSVQSVTDNDGQVLYWVPAGQAVQFTVTASIDPKRLFAGEYHGVLASIWVSPVVNDRSKTIQLIVPSNKTNTKVIIGEVSPYISSASYSNGSVVVNGQRLSNVIIYVDGVERDPSSVRRSTDGTSLVFSIPLSDGQHYIQVKDNTGANTGSSNAAYFQVGSVTIPVACPMGYICTPSNGTPRIGNCPENYTCRFIDSPSASVTALLVGADSDKVGSSFGPGVGIGNKNANDWHWRMSISNPKNIRIKSISIKSNSSGEGWSTSDDTSLLGKVLYPIAVYLNGNSLNSAYNYITASDINGMTFDLYGQPESVPFTGGTVVVKFGDDTIATGNIAASSIRQDVPPTVTVCPAGYTCTYSPGTPVPYVAGCPTSYICSFATGVSVAKPTFTVTSPAGDETFARGSMMTISWRTENYSGRQVAVVLRKTDYVHAFPDFGQYTAYVDNTGSHTFRLDVEGGKYIARVVCSPLDSNCVYVDSRPFTISPSVSVVAPTINVRAAHNNAYSSPVEVDSRPFGGFTVDVANEPVQLNYIRFLYTSVPHCPSAPQNVYIANENGITVAGPINSVNSEIAFNGNVTFPVGSHSYKLLGKISSTCAAGTVLTFGGVPYQWTGARGQTTGTAIDMTKVSGFAMSAVTVAAPVTTPVTASVNEDSSLTASIWDAIKQYCLENPKDKYCVLGL